MVVLVTGDVDVRKRAEVGAALREALDHGGPEGDIDVDARHLRYCDTHTASVLDDTARRLSGRRHLVVL